ncbi:MAG: hypothetical protein JXN60_00145 [Lentisphaerae bacterium]|nr:hypothetical protein [Lentisphaerota bacterium]
MSTKLRSISTGQMDPILKKTEFWIFDIYDAGMRKIWGYYAAIFLSAFLLFQIQPLTSKALLPVFGGSYLVWGASMVFYQGMLLVGYIYAHAMQRWLGVVRYSRFHWILLIAPTAMFPFRFERFASGAEGVPLVAAVFILLFVSVSLPLLTLSTTSVLLQRWFSISHSEGSRNPYVLYSASNLGSMLGLLSYPVIVEPFFSLDFQGYVWWIGYALMVLIHLSCVPSRASKEDRRMEAVESAGIARVDIKMRVVWFALSASACASLIAVTNIITFDVASVPFLWVLPLSVYLFAFVVAFKRKMWFPAWLQTGVYWALIVGALMYLMSQLRLAIPGWVSITIHLTILFVVCLNCCAALVRVKPTDARLLTMFYLMVAFGGFFGSLSVTWCMPLVSPTLVEYPLSFALVMLSLALANDALGAVWRRSSIVETAICLTLGVLALTLLPWMLNRFFAMDEDRMRIALIIIAVPVALVLLKLVNKSLQFGIVLVAMSLAFAWTEQLYVGADSVVRHRNFYGVYKVYDKGNMRYLQHGTTLHGREYTQGPKAGIPLSYFHPSTPAGLILTCNKFFFRDIGMIGLGTGALASYAGEGQRFTVYELDHDNLHIADKNFTYLRTARNKGADLRFVFGDGRISLRKEQSDSLDLIIIDAFNSGSIPVHLLTVEAFQEYFRVLRKNGLLLLHVSNKVLDLAPVVYSNALKLNLFVCEQTNIGNCHPDADDTIWMAASEDEAVIDVLRLHLRWWKRFGSDDSLPRAWTDRYSNIIGVMIRW